MSFARAKRWALAWLALIAPLPLPWNGALEWWVLVVYVLLVIRFLQRVEQGTVVPLTTRTLNLLGLLYIPILILDLRRGALSSSFLEPLLHLLLFLLVVKLYALRREGEKWQVLVAIFFVFAGSMATSSHLSIIIYLVAFVVLMTVVLLRFAHFHAFDTAGGEPRSTAAALAESGTPLRLPIALATVSVVLLAIPLFAFLPRFRDPFIFGQGGADGGRIAGFSDAVDLTSTSAIRGNRSVVMRLTYDGSRPREMRFKASTYDRYQSGRWIRLPRLARMVWPEDGGRFVLAADGRQVGAVDVFLQPLRSSSLVLPLESVAMTGIPVSNLLRDPGGAYRLPSIPSEAIGYRVELGSAPAIQAAELDDRHRSALDLSGVTPPIRALAREVMADGPDGERIARLERHLLQSYDYTLDFVGQDGGHPLEDFLFVNRRGHCELFASSMVLMLRAEGIPARLVAGFLDAEHNALQGYYIVRQDNAHAWVEAYDPERGWAVYDPTPPEGRPSAAEWSFGLALTQLYDFMIFRWDRYVLSFGADDQASFFERIRGAVSRAWEQILGLWPRPEPDDAVPVVERGPRTVDLAPAAPPRSRRPTLLILMLAPLSVLAALMVLYWRRRRPRTAALAYRRLRQLLDRAGCEISAALAPRALERFAAARYPHAAPAVERLVALYLEESFGERSLRAAERRTLGESLTAVGQALRRGGRVTPAV